MTNEGAGTTGSVVILVAVLIIIGVAHFLPPVIAVNLLLGLTGIAWIVALVWSFTAIYNPRNYR